jgi:tetratricopeptide (TPR) repeat protein
LNIIKNITTIIKKKYYNTKRNIEKVIKKLYQKRIMNIGKKIKNKEMEKLKKDTVDFSKKLVNFEKAKSNFDVKFTPYAKCQDIEKIYQKKFDANPTDLALLQKITKIMNKKKCTTSPLFFSAATKLHELQPTAESAFLVGVMNFSKNDFAKAKEYFEEATKLYTEDDQKAKAYLMLAFTCSAMKQYGVARSYAYKYAAIKPGDGTPYILIGDMYAQSAASCGSDELTSRVANWTAVDKYNKAKAIDKSKEAEANQRINAAASRFPSKEAVFFNNLKKGQSYTVGCWINENTTVR